MQVLTHGGEPERKLVAFARNPDGSIVPMKSRGGASGGAYTFQRYYLPKPELAKEGWTIGFATSVPMRTEFVVDIRPHLEKLDRYRGVEARTRAAFEQHRRSKAGQDKK